MTERHLADRWQVSLKTLRRWRLDNEGPVWHKLFRHVRYQEADVIEFERRSAHQVKAKDVNNFLDKKYRWTAILIVDVFLFA